MIVTKWWILGNLLGGLRYLGSCSLCRTQFMSTHDRVATTSNGCILCKACGKVTETHSASVPA